MAGKHVLRSEGGMTTEPIPLNPDRLALVERAARWLADQPHAPSPLIPVLIDEFTLSVAEACRAAGMAHRYRVYRAAAS
jgi:hypothetical protein